MAKTSKSYMVRRGRRYLIERTAEGTFARWIPVGGGNKKSAKKASKRTTGRKTSSVKSSKTAGRKSASSRSRARY